MTIIRIGPDTPKYRTRINNEAKDCFRDYDTSKFEGRLAASPIVNEMSAPSRIGLPGSIDHVRRGINAGGDSASTPEFEGKITIQGRPEPTDCPWANGESGSEPRETGFNKLNEKEASDARDD